MRDVHPVDDPMVSFREREKGKGYYIAPNNSLFFFKYFHRCDDDELNASNGDSAHVWWPRGVRQDADGLNVLGRRAVAGRLTIRLRIRVLKLGSYKRIR